MFNRRQYRKINDRKRLHKIRKRWVVMSTAVFSMLGAGALANSIPTHASTVQDTASVNQKQTEQQVHSNQSSPADAQKSTMQPSMNTKPSSTAPSAQPAVNRTASSQSTVQKSVARPRVQQPVVHQPVNRGVIRAHAPVNNVMAGQRQEQQSAAEHAVATSEANASVESSEQAVRNDEAQAQHETAQANENDTAAARDAHMSVQRHPAVSGTPKTDVPNSATANRTEVSRSNMASSTIMSQTTEDAQHKISQQHVQAPSFANHSANSNAQSVSTGMTTKMQQYDQSLSATEAFEAHQRATHMVSHVATQAHRLNGILSHQQHQFDGKIDQILKQNSVSNQKSASNSAGQWHQISNRSGNSYGSVKVPNVHIESGRESAMSNLPVSGTDRSQLNPVNVDPRAKQIQKNLKALGTARGNVQGAANSMHKHLLGATLSASLPSGVNYQQSWPGTAYVGGAGEASVHSDAVFNVPSDINNTSQIDTIAKGTHMVPYQNVTGSKQIPASYAPDYSKVTAESDLPSDAMESGDNKPIKAYTGSAMADGVYQHLSGNMWTLAGIDHDGQWLPATYGPAYNSSDFIYTPAKTVNTYSDGSNAVNNTETINWNTIYHTTNGHNYGYVPQYNGWVNLQDTSIPVSPWQAVPRQTDETINYVNNSQQVGSTTMNGIIGQQGTADGSNMPQGYQLANDNTSHFVFTSNGNTNVNVNKIPATSTASSTATSASSQSSASSSAAPTIDTDTINYIYNNNVIGSTKMTGTANSSVVADGSNLPSGYVLNGDSTNLITFNNSTHNVNVKAVPITDTIDYMNNGSQVGQTTMTGAENTQAQVNGSNMPNGYQLNGDSSNIITYDGLAHDVDVDRTTPTSTSSTINSNTSSSSTNPSSSSNSANAQKIDTDTIDYMNNGSQVGQTTMAGADGSLGIANGDNMPSGFQLTDDGTNSFLFNNGSHDVDVEQISNSSTANMSSNSDASTNDSDTKAVVDTDTINYMYNGNQVGTTTMSGDANTNIIADGSNMPQGYWLNGDSSNNFVFNNGTHDVDVQPVSDFSNSSSANSANASASANGSSAASSSAASAASSSNGSDQFIGYDPMQVPVGVHTFSDNVGPLAVYPNIDPAHPISNPDKSTYGIIPAGYAPAWIPNGQGKYVAGLMPNNNIPDDYAAGFVPDGHGNYLAGYVPKGNLPSGPGIAKYIIGEIPTGTGAHILGYLPNIEPFDTNSGRIDIDYINQTNGNLVSQEHATGKNGDEFNPMPYGQYIPNGYHYIRTSGVVTSFDDGTQTMKIIVAGNTSQSVTPNSDNQQSNNSDNTNSDNSDNTSSDWQDTTSDVNSLIDSAASASVASDVAYNKAHGYSAGNLPNAHYSTYTNSNYSYHPMVYNYDPYGYNGPVGGALNTPFSFEYGYGYDSSRFDPMFNFGYQQAANGQPINPEYYYRNPAAYMGGYDTYFNGFYDGMGANTPDNIYQGYAQVPYGQAYGYGQQYGLKHGYINKNGQRTNSRNNSNSDIPSDDGADLSDTPSDSAQYTQDLQNLGFRDGTHDVDGQPVSQNQGAANNSSDSNNSSDNNNSDTNPSDQQPGVPDITYQNGYDAGVKHAEQEMNHNQAQNGSNANSGNSDTNSDNINNGNNSGSDTSNNSSNNNGSDNNSSDDNGGDTSGTSHGYPKAKKSFKPQKTNLPDGSEGKDSHGKYVVEDGSKFYFDPKTDTYDLAWDPDDDELIVFNDFVYSDSDPSDWDSDDWSDWDNYKTPTTQYSDDDTWSPKDNDQTSDMLG